MTEKNRNPSNEDCKIIEVDSKLCELEDEERFEELAKYGLKQLEGLDDSQMVVIDDFPEEGKTYSVAEVKNLIATMKDKDNPFTCGVPTVFIVLSIHPEEFFRKNAEALQRSKQFNLNKLAHYSDDQLLTYVHPNRYEDMFTGKAQYYQRTAKELRDWIHTMDWTQNEMLSHYGGIRVISSNPTVSLKELDERAVVNKRIFDAMIQAMITEINIEPAFKERIMKEIENLPDDATVSYPLNDGSQSPEMSVKKLKAVLGVKPQA